MICGYYIYKEIREASRGAAFSCVRETVNSFDPFTGAVAINLFTGAVTINPFTGAVTINPFTGAVTIIPSLPLIFPLVQLPLIPSLVWLPLPLIFSPVWLPLSKNISLELIFVEFICPQKFHPTNIMNQCKETCTLYTHVARDGEIMGPMLQEMVK